MNRTRAPIARRRATGQKSGAAFRKGLLTSSGMVLAAVSLGSASAAMAQREADADTLARLDQCAQTEDMSSRLACYDGVMRARSAAAGQAPGARAASQIRSAGAIASAAGAASPASPASPAASPASPAANPGAASDFGRETIRSPDRFEVPEGELQSLTATVASVREREPGVFAITLEDGATWQFMQSAGSIYRPPRRGSQVTIDRGAIGSFLLRFDGQRAIQVRRMR